MGQRAVVVGLLIVMLAVCVAGLWPHGALNPLAAGARPLPRPTDPDLAAASPGASDEPLTPAAAREPAREPAAPPSSASRDDIDRWIRDLAHDDVPRNAARALHRLRNEPAAYASLQAALASRDLQQRQLAALALIGQGRPCTADLATVLVEAMSIEVERELRRAIPGSTAKAAALYLYRHPENSRPALRQALWTGDPQQRYLSTFLLACDGSIDDAAQLVPTLVRRLADNNRSGDALMAAHALYRLGDPVAPLLRTWRPHVDRQARELIDLILLDLDSPPRTRAELVARKRLHDVTSVYHDPVIEYSFGRSSMPTR